MVTVELKVFFFGTLFMSLEIPEIWEMILWEIIKTWAQTTQWLSCSKYQLAAQQQAQTCY